MAEEPKHCNPEAGAQQSGTAKKASASASQGGVHAAPRAEAPPRTKRTASSTRRQTAQQVAAEDRWNMIAAAAYYRAEKRGFVGGTPAQDWAEAELEIEALLAGCTPSEEK